MNRFPPATRPVGPLESIRSSRRSPGSSHVRCQRTCRPGSHVFPDRGLGDSEHSCSATAYAIRDNRHEVPLRTSAPASGPSRERLALRLRLRRRTRSGSASSPILLSPRSRTTLAALVVIDRIDLRLPAERAHARSSSACCVPALSSRSCRRRVSPIPPCRLEQGSRSSVD